MTRLFPADSFRFRHMDERGNESDLDLCYMSAGEALARFKAANSVAGRTACRP